MFVDPCSPFSLRSVDSAQHSLPQVFCLSKTEELLQTYEIRSRIPLSVVYIAGTEVVYFIAALCVYTRSAEIHTLGSGNNNDSSAK